MSNSWIISSRSRNADAVDVELPPLEAKQVLTRKSQINVRSFVRESEGEVRTILTRRRREREKRESEGSLLCTLRSRRARPRRGTLEVTPQTLQEAEEDFSYEP